MRYQNFNNQTMKKIIFTLLACTMIITGSFAQGSIASFVPNNAVAGSTLDLVVYGSGTHWNATITKSNVMFTGGAGNVTVNNVTVNNPELMMINITIDASASGDKIFTIKQGPNTYTSPMPFSMIAGGSLSINLMVNPVQSINLSDFDPNNLNSAPILFTVTIINDAAAKNNLEAELTVSGEKSGRVGTATKGISSLSANQQFTFNNKEFENYKLDQSNTTFFNNAINTGTLPSDDYTYTLVLRNKNTKAVLGTGTAKTVISTPSTRPELISPGSNISMPAEVMRNPLPLFQWFSQGSNFELSVYPVFDGQKTAEEVTNNRPIFKQANVTGTSFMYPSSAEIFIDGKIYAWQIRRSVTASSGNTVLSSEVFWFRYQGAGKPILTVADIKINPEEAVVPSGGSYKFTATAYSVNNELVPDAVITWKVVPATAGTIDKNGLFTASNTAGTAAIIAKGGESTVEYANVTIAPAYSGNMTEASMKLFIQKLFGLTK